MSASAPRQRRHKNFEVSHQDMIQAAVRLISQKGVGAVSIAAVARETGINRTTVYYHFESRASLIHAVKEWAAEQLARAFTPSAPQEQRIDYITRFVLENPELIKLWIEDLIAVGDIRTRYPPWDALVTGIRAKATAKQPHAAAVDAEVYSVILLSSAIIGPRIFKNSVCPDEDNETIVRRFRLEQQRLLKHNALLREPKRSRDHVASAKPVKRTSKRRTR